MKKIIINADDFGYSKDVNEAVRLGVKTGVITSASLLSNFEAFEDALKILDELPEIKLGFHFNIMEGKSLTNPSVMTDNSGYFYGSWIKTMLKSPSKEFKRQLETEFRAQLEKILKYNTNITHVDSHVHTHAIPPIFEIVSKLADEYKIPFIRTQNELPYKIKDAGVNSKFCINTLKNIILNTFSTVNKMKHPDIKTNDYFIGVLYTGGMTQKAIIEGLKKVKDSSLTEIIFHPSVDKSKPASYREFEITRDKNFIENLKAAGCIQI